MSVDLWFSLDRLQKVTRFHRGPMVHLHRRFKSDRRWWPVGFVDSVEQVAL